MLNDAAIHNLATVTQDCSNNIIEKQLLTQQAKATILTCRGLLVVCKQVFLISETYCREESER